MHVQMANYEIFFAAKTPSAKLSGIIPNAMPSHLRDYQRDVTSFALRIGRSAMFLDTGLGKTACELEWCRQAAEASNGRALLLTPLAVARQIETEAHRWGYDARVIRNQDDATDGINICNYDRMELLNPAAFGAVALDESSILKSFTGATTRGLIAAFSDHRFKLCATATPAPNDHMELANHAEFLGQMNRLEMLSRWFINDTNEASQSWRLKKHAEESFWDWMASWAKCAETPADLGYDASGFVLPPLNIIRHKVAGDVRAPAGVLFVEDVSATTLHGIKRQTADSRAESVAKLIANENEECWVIWCDTDYEADALRAHIPDAIEVRGSHSPTIKETKLAEFSSGKARILISKPSVCGMGMNWQHCARTAYVGRSFSYESWYQSVRRFWRYGQTRPVNVHLMVAEGEDQIGRVINRKADGHNAMKRAMAAAMKRASAEQTVKITYNPTHIGKLPKWMKFFV